MNARVRTALNWALVGFEAVLVLQVHFAPDLLPPLATKALITLVPLVFLFVHGSGLHRVRDLVVFSCIVLVVSNVIENIGVLTGFPFGHYYYADNLGPKLINVPLLVGPVYLGTGYLAWTIARTIVGASTTRLVGYQRMAVPLLAGWMMVAFDLSLDPVWATIERGWVWRDGGHYLGIPYVNFLGWLLTTCVFFGLITVYLNHRPGSVRDQPLTRQAAAPALVLYGLTAVTFLLNPLTPTTTGDVTDPAGGVWSTAEIYTTTSLLALFVMGGFVAVGSIRAMELPRSRDHMGGILPGSVGELGNVDQPV